jgi:predicted heme/steroid binding protein
MSTSYDELVAEMDQLSRDAYCDVYNVHDGHTYRAVNGNTYDCPGLLAAGSHASLVESDADLCEHGMSASLCGGPMHWYDR